MKFKITGNKDFFSGRETIRIDATRTDWDDVPYLDENDKWVNGDKMLNVCMIWDKDPVKMGEALNAGLNELMHYLETGKSPPSIADFLNRSIENE